MSERTSTGPRLLEVAWDDPRATALRDELDADGTPTGHVILRRLGDEWEIKRLVVTAAARGRGIARALMHAALDRARTGGAERVILQTGIPQPESVALYESLGFTRIPVYEPYAETMPRSVCFALTL